MSINTAPSLIGGVMVENLRQSQLELSRAAEQAARTDEIVRIARHEERAHRTAQKIAQKNAAASSEGSMPRWTMWLPSVLRHRSSDVSQNSGACANC